MWLRTVVNELRGSAAADDDAGDAAYYFAVTLVVGIAMVMGATLQWLPAQPHPLRLIAFAVAYLVGGYRIVVDSWVELRHRRLSIDFLMGAAAVGAALVGSPLEGVILIFLFSLSKALEGYAMGRTRHAIARLMDLHPDEATLADPQGRALSRIAVEDLVPGQAILVRPGERIAADGIVRSGRTEVDQAAITGESVPVRKATGDEVYAGTINQAGALVVEVTRRAGETMLARIVRLVAEAQEERAPAQNFIDRFAHPYTLLVVAATAVAATAPPLLTGVPWQEAFYRAMTLLVVASPCALVISTPSAILSGIANGARHGVLFKGGAYLDLAGTIDVIAFDKTGTLTIGRPRLMGVVTEDGAEAEPHAGGSVLEPSDIIRLAAAVEASSEHHLARAIAEAAESGGLEVPLAEGFDSIAGEGVVAWVKGRRIWVGNDRMVVREGARLSERLRRWTADQTALGRSVVFVGGEGSVHGAMAFGDALKPGAAAAVRHLKEEGVKWITILSGDHPEAVRAVAAELGADDVHAGLLPHEKVATVRQLASIASGVAMVGDGVNDAPAMAAATLGVAMGAVGTDVAIETADVVLMSDDLERVDYLLHLGRRARRVVRQNVYFSIGWMLLLVGVTVTVGLPLPLAVVGHEGSTLLVAANGLRLLHGRPHSSVQEPAKTGERIVGGGRGVVAAARR